MVAEVTNKRQPNGAKPVAVKKFKLMRKVFPLFLEIGLGNFNSFMSTFFLVIAQERNPD